MTERIGALKYQSLGISPRKAETYLKTKTDVTDVYLADLTVYKWLEDGGQALLT